MGEFNKPGFAILYMITLVTLSSLFVIVIRILYKHQDLIVVIGLVIAYFVARKNIIRMNNV
jgi:hypothetical protein